MNDLKKKVLDHAQILSCYNVFLEIPITVNSLTQRGSSAVPTSISKSSLIIGQVNAVLNFSDLDTVNSLTQRGSSAVPTSISESLLIIGQVNAVLNFSDSRGSKRKTRFRGHCNSRDYMHDHFGLARTS